MCKKSCLSLAVKAAALLWMSLFFCNFAQADIDYSTIGWWQIKFAQVDQDISGCYAIAHFQGQTAITLSLLQHIDKSDKIWVIHIYNPEWNVWIRNKKQHVLHFMAAKPWQGTFSVANDNSLFALVSSGFINSVPMHIL